MKQNAVDWLIEQIHKNSDWIPIHIQDQAIAMFEEQIEQAYSDGIDDERYDRQLKLGKYYQSVFKEDKQ